MELVALKAFSWAHAGVRIEEFVKDQIIETEDEDLIKVAMQEKWVKQAGKAESKAKNEKPGTAPLNPETPPLNPEAPPLNPAPEL